MPFRFRKTISIAKGLKLNLSKRGTSLSLGGKGASLNLSNRGTRTTIGIPGSGISYSVTDNIDSQPKETYESPSNRMTGLDILSFLTSGIGLIYSAVGFLVSCVLALLMLYFLYYLFLAL